jgi:hypothetical protein
MASVGYRPEADGEEVLATVIDTIRVYAIAVAGELPL